AKLKIVAVDLHARQLLGAVRDENRTLRYALAHACHENVAPAPSKRREICSYNSLMSRYVPVVRTARAQASSLPARRLSQCSTLVGPCRSAALSANCSPATRKPKPPSRCAAARAGTSPTSS